MRKAIQDKIAALNKTISDLRENANNCNGKEVSMIVLNRIYTLEYGINLLRELLNN